MRALALSAWAMVTLFAGCTYECNGSNCSDGCCGANGVCYVGGSDQFCGLQGASCQDCGAQQKVCGGGVCDVACVADSPCETRLDCCAKHLCVDGRCVACRSSGQSCFHHEDCCAYPAQTCQQYNFAWVCRSL